MTETCTNKVNLAGKSRIEDSDYYNELNYYEKQFYNEIASELNRLQLFPKEETIQKIIAYSRSKK